MVICETPGCEEEIVLNPKAKKKKRFCSECLRLKNIEASTRISNKIIDLKCDVCGETLKLKNHRKYKKNYCIKCEPDEVKSRNKAYRKKEGKVKCPSCEKWKKKKNMINNKDRKVCSGCYRKETIEEDALHAQELRYNPERSHNGCALDEL